MRNTCGAIGFVLLASAACSKSRRSPSPVQPAEITIEVVLEDEQTRAGAGLPVFVDGMPAGATSTDGSFVMAVGTGTHVVRVVDPWLAGGGHTFPDLAPGVKASAKVVLTNAGVREPVRLEIAELQDGVLPLGFASFEARFVDDEPKIPRLQGSFTLESAAALVVLDLEAEFELTGDGWLRHKAPDAIRQLLAAMTGEVDVRFTAIDDRGFRFDASLPLRVGRHRVTGQLAAPPSNPSLPLAGVPIFARLLNSPVTFPTTSDAAGTFVLPHVPNGVLEFDFAVEASGNTYNGFGTMSIQGGTDLTLTLVSGLDVRNGVPSIRRNGDSPRHGLVPRLPRSASPVALPAGDWLVTATSAAENQRVHRAETVSVAQGTSAITFEYEVISAEYPDYVLIQSEFDDVWELGVFTPTGARLFQLTRSVNQQLYLEPIWQPTGTTGRLRATLDVSHLTATRAQDLVVFAAATNVGDDLYPTTASARTGPALLTIKSVSEQGRDVISVPRPGSTNTIHRTFAATIEKPQEVTIEQVFLDLIRADSNVLLAPVVTAEQRSLVEVEEDRVLVRFTIGPENVWQLGSAPPPAGKIAYRLTVVGRQGSGEVRDSKVSRKFSGLWRMPDGIPRFGFRDAGGDDWCSREAYLWIDEHRALLPAINDISGEHGRNIGHSTHTRGTDVDIYHYVHLLGAADRKGSANYAALRANAGRALRGDAASRQAVVDWFRTHREKLAQLDAMETVARVWVGFGIEGDGLPRGWYRALLLNGQVESLDLGIGTFTAAKIQADSSYEHEDHMHIDLDDVRLLTRYPE